MMPAQKSPGPPVLRAAPLPPHDLETEQAVLSTVLEVPGAIERVRGLLAVSDWYADAHALIWTAACECEDPNVATVKKRLENKGLLQQAGGAKYLVELHYEAPVTSQLEKKARQLRELAEVRRLIAFCHATAADGYGLTDAVQIRAKMAIELAASPAGSVLARSEAAELFEPLPPIPWLCESLDLAPGAPALFAGYGYSGKTVACQALAMAVATGRPAWGRYAVQRGKVLHLDYEQGGWLTRKRYQRLARTMGIEREDIEGWLTWASMPPLYLDSEGAETAFAGELRGHALCIVDCLRAGAPGIDENESSSRRVLDMLARVSEKTGCIVVVLHHCRKPAMSDKGGAKMAIRGSGALFDACASVLVLEAEKGEAPIVCHEKARWSGRLEAPFALVVEDTLGPNGEENWGLSVSAHDAESESEKRDDERFSEVCESVLDLVKKNHGCNTSFVVERLKKRKNGVGAALNYLKRNGAITNLSKSDHKAEWYPVDSRGKTEAENESR